MNTIRRTIRHVLGLAVAGLCLYLAFGRLDWEPIASVIRTAALGPLLLGLVSLAVGFGVRATRWWWMLRALDRGLPLRVCVWPFLASFAVNNVLPLRAGDVLRTVGFRGQLRAPPMRILGSLIIERLFDLLVLLAVFFLGLSRVPTGVLPPYVINTGIWVGIASLIALLALLLLPERIQRLLAWFTRLPWLSRRRAAAWIRTWSEQLVGSLMLLRSPALFLQLLAFSAAGWAFEGGMFAATAWSLRVEAEAFAPWFSLGTGTLATLLPSTPGYVGTFDFFAMLGLMAYGATRTAAAAFALLVHAILWGPVTLAGLIFLGMPRGRGAWRRSREVEHPAEGEPDG
jgi:uncharacterized protein (TIRG00374 family)